MRAGQDPATFWDQTPATFETVLEGVRERVRDEHVARMSAAWHGAYWQRVKSMPAHDKAVGLKRRPKRQSVAEMAANVRAWRIALGGQP